MISNKRISVVAENAGDVTFLPQVPGGDLTYGPNFGYLVKAYGWHDDTDIVWPAVPSLSGTLNDQVSWGGGTLLGHVVASVSLLEYRTSSDGDWVRDFFYIKFQGPGPGEEAMNAYPAIRFESNGNYVDLSTRFTNGSDYSEQGGFSAWRVWAAQVEQVALKQLFATALAMGDEISIEVIGADHTSGSVIPGETLDRIEDGGEARVDYHGYFDNQPFHPSAFMDPIGEMTEGGLLGWSVDSFGIVDYEISNGGGGWQDTTATLLFRLTPGPGIDAEAGLDYDSVTITHGTKTVTIPKADMYWAVNELAGNKVALSWRSVILESWISGGLGSTPLTYQFNGIKPSYSNSKLHVNTADGWKDMGDSNGIRRGWIRTIDPEDGAVWSPLQLTAGMCDDAMFFGDPSANTYSGVFSLTDGRLLTERLRQNPDNLNWSLMSVQSGGEKLQRDAGSAPAMDNTTRRFRASFGVERYKVDRFPVGTGTPSTVDIQSEGKAGGDGAPFVDYDESDNATLGTAFSTDGSYFGGDLIDFLTIDDPSHPIHGYAPSSWGYSDADTVWMPNIFSPCMFSLMGNKDTSVDEYGPDIENGYAILYPYSRTGNEDIRMHLSSTPADEKFLYVNAHRGVLVRFTRNQFISNLSFVAPVANVPSGALDGSVEGITVSELTGDRHVVNISTVKRVGSASFNRGGRQHIRRRGALYTLGVNTATNSVISSDWFNAWDGNGNYSNFDEYSAVGILNGSCVTTNDDGSESVITSYVVQIYFRHSTLETYSFQTEHAFHVKTKNPDGSFDTSVRSSTTWATPNNSPVVTHSESGNDSAYPNPPTSWPEENSPYVLGLIAQFSLFKDTGARKGEALGLTRVPHLDGKKAEYRPIKLKFHLEGYIVPGDDYFTIDRVGGGTLGAVRVETFDDDSLETVTARPRITLDKVPSLTPLDSEYGYLQRICPATFEFLEDQQALPNATAVDMSYWGSVLPGELQHVRLYPTGVQTPSGEEWVIAASGLRIIDQNQGTLNQQGNGLETINFLTTANNESLLEPYRCPGVSLFPVYPGKFKEIDGDISVPTSTSLLVSQNTNNIVLRTLYDSVHSTQYDVVEFEFADNVEIGSSSTSNYSFDTGTWDWDVTIILKFGAASYVVGAGGRGGNANNGAGGDGGPAMKIRLPVIIDADPSSVIGGGGGGGAGGKKRSGQGGGGGGGGGGAGKTAGGRGTGTSPGGGAGGVGSLTAGGNGGARGDGPFSNDYGWAGGKGGNLGANGGNAVSASGGQAGIAIDGISLVTFERQGSVLGPTIN